MKCELQKNFIVEAKIVAFCTLFIRVRRKALSPKAYPSTTRCRSRGVCHAVAEGCAFISRRRWVRPFRGLRDRSGWQSRSS